MLDQANGKRWLEYDGNRYDRFQIIKESKLQKQKENNKWVQAIFTQVNDAGDDGSIIRLDD